MGRPCSDVSKKVWDFYVSLGIWDGIGNPINGCGVKIAPDINHKYDGLDRSCPRDSKNLS